MVLTMKYVGFNRQFSQTKQSNEYWIQPMGISPMILDPALMLDSYRVWIEQMGITMYTKSWSKKCPVRKWNSWSMLKRFVTKNKFLTVVQSIHGSMWTQTVYRDQHNLHLIQYKSRGWATPWQNIFECQFGIIIPFRWWKKQVRNHKPDMGTPKNPWDT
jgi:hypothetical protein